MKYEPIMRNELQLLGYDVSGMDSYDIAETFYNVVILKSDYAKQNNLQPVTTAKGWLDLIGTAVSGFFGWLQGTNQVDMTEQQIRLAEQVYSYQYSLQKQKTTGLIIVIVIVFTALVIFKS